MAEGRIIELGQNDVSKGRLWVLLQLLARKHNKESSALLQELSLKKAEAISALTENFWKEKGGRTYVEAQPSSVFR